MEASPARRPPAGEIGAVPRLRGAPPLWKTHRFAGGRTITEPERSAGRAGRERASGGPPPTPARPPIAVVGGNAAPDAVLALAEAVGREIAAAGFPLVCGGLGGVMEAACRGAAAAGGLTVGFLPGSDPREANPFVRVPLATGLGHFRNFLVVRAAAGVVALPGAAGTLSEAAMARTLGRPVVALGDASAAAVPGARKAGSAAEAVALVLRLAGEVPDEVPAARAESRRGRDGEGDGERDREGAGG